MITVIIELLKALPMMLATIAKLKEMNAKKAEVKFLKAVDDAKRKII